MSVKEVLPAFIWAGVVVGGTSLAMAWYWSHQATAEELSRGRGDFMAVSPFDH